MLLFCDWKRKSTEPKEKKICPFFGRSVSQRARGREVGKKGIGRERRRVGLRKGLPYKSESVITQHQINRFSAAYTEIRDLKIQRRGR